MNDIVTYCKTFSPPFTMFLPDESHNNADKSPPERVNLTMQNLLHPWHSYCAISRHPGGCDPGLTSR